GHHNQRGLSAEGLATAPALPPPPPKCARSLGTRGPALRSHLVPRPGIPCPKPQTPFPAKAPSQSVLEADLGRPGTWTGLGGAAGDVAGGQRLTPRTKSPAPPSQNPLARQSRTRSWSRTARPVTSPPGAVARRSTSAHRGAQRCPCSSPTAHALALVRFYVSAALPALAASSSDCASGVKVTDKMVPPVQVSPLIKLGRYSALFLGVAYGAKRYSYLKPRAEEERRIAAEEKKKQDERKRIERELAEAQDDSILK
uniref:ATP synthase F(0) complex subunit e, mitochondrial n=2 Tax=Felidae TaxID=9681 RepID=A0ABI7VV31_FELCA